ncbi:MAG: 3-phosphoshikimate 1-carboxyvinyltransferase [Thermoproteota archaeon]
MKEQESTRRVVIKGDQILSGEVRAPPSKSYSHRVLMCSAFSEGRSRIMKLLICEDILATISVLRGMGAKIKLKPETSTAEVQGTIPMEPENVLFCSESASTLRMCLPLAASQKFFSIFSGVGSLIRRPVGPILDALSYLGVEVRSRKGYVPVALDSKGFSGDHVSVSASFGSQHISGLLISSPLTPHGMRIDVIDEATSKPYIDLTIDVMRRFGVVVERKGYESFVVKPGQSYRGCEVTVPGDYSSASFLMAAAISTCSKLSILGLPKEGFPDSKLLDILRSFGAELKVGPGVISISGKGLRGVDVDCKDIPDLVPALTAIAFFAEGSTRLRGVSRLSSKESSRAEALVSEFQKMGGKISIEGEDLIIRPSGRLRGCSVSSWGDHRIEMALAVAGLGADGETVINDAMRVSKSYPRFYEDLANLGAEIDAG